jgi:hypothetical protein
MLLHEALEVEAELEAGRRQGSQPISSPNTFWVMVLLFFIARWR